MTGVKFSQFSNGGDLEDGDIIVGLRDGVNTKFNAPGNPSDIYLLKADNLSDLPDVALALQNIQQGSGETILINDSDFVANVYEIQNPYPRFIIATINTPGMQIRLPVANTSISPALGSGPIIQSVGSSEEVDLGDSSGTSLYGIKNSSRTWIVLDNNSTSSGSWNILPQVVIVNDQSGVIFFISNDGSVIFDSSVPGFIDVSVSSSVLPPTLTKGQLIIGTDTSPVAGNLISSDDSVVIDTSIDGEINLTVGPSAQESLQDAYEIGNTIELDEARPLQFFSQSNQTPLEAVTSPSTGLSSTANYAIQGWVFIPDVAVSVTALQYLDVNLSSGSRDVGIYRKSNGTLLVSTKVTKTSPLVGFYRTTTLDTPITLIGGEEYVICVVVFPSENYNLNGDAVTAVNISATQRCTGAVSSTPIPLSFPTNYIATPNTTPEGYFIYEVIVPNASIEFHSGQDATSYMMRSVSTTLGNIPLPVMSTDNFRAIPSKAYGLMAFSSDSSRPLAFNNIGANQLLAYVSDISFQAEGGGYGLTIDAGNTVGADSISIVYSSYQRIQNRVNVTARLTFVPTQVDPVIAFYTTFNLIPFSDADQASGLGNLWLTTAPTGLDGSAQVHSIASASSVAAMMITPDFDSVKSYELNVMYSYIISPDTFLNPFISIWDTTTDNPSNVEIGLPLVSTGTYNMIVDWGDGNYNHITDYSDPNAYHDYDSPGTYTVRIFGTCIGWSFGENYTTPGNLIDITQWGILQMYDGGVYGGFFYDTYWMNQISAVDTPNLSGLTTLQEAFYDSAIVFINNVDTWDVSLVEDFSYCFSTCWQFEGAGIGNWDVSSGTVMDSMFDSCDVFNGPLNDWNVSNVTSMAAMFYNCFAFNQDLDNWVTSSCTDISYMFSGASAFNGQVDGWDTSNVTTLQSCFNNASSFNSPVSSWNTSNVTTFSDCFTGATSFNQTIETWDFSSTTSLDTLLSGCTSFNQPMNGIDVSNITSMVATFNGCAAFNQPLDTWDVSNVTIFADMFYNCASFNQDLSGWDVSSGTSFTLMFGGTLANYDLSAWDMSSATDISGMFISSSYNQPLAWDVSSVTNFSYVFSGNLVFDQDLSSWDVSAGLNFQGMFSGAISFDSPLDNWDLTTCANGPTFPQVTEMFNGATSFNQNLSSWTTGNMYTYISMFQNCVALDQDFSNFSNLGLGNANNMFAGCTLSNANYNKLLFAWATVGAGAGVLFSGGNSHYDATSGGVDGVTAHNYLTATKLWSITDGGTP